MTSPDLLPQAVSCAAPGCVRPPAEGLLCAGHRRKLDDTLIDIGNLLNASAAKSITGWRVSDGGGSSGGLASQREPINLGLIDAQRHGAPELARWAVWLVDNRPGLVRTGDPTNDVRLLRYDLDWIAAHRDADRFWQGMRALWSSLRGDLPWKECECVDPATGRHGPVWAEKGVGGWCSWCGTVWAGSDLLKLRLHGARRGAA